MRDEHTIIKLITDFAESRDIIRYVVMNGSRVNPKVNKDILQDYDICYGVTDKSCFLNSKSWMNYFGDLVIYQHNIIKVTIKKEEHIFLMQFKDFVRMDLSLRDYKDWKREKEDSLTVVLLDKDNLLNDLPGPDDSMYITKKPTQEMIIMKYGMH